MRILGGILALAIFIGACSDDATSLNGIGTAKSTQTPAGQPRSYKNDVYPVLISSCALSSCHGDKSGSAGVGIFLPQGDPDGIYTDLINLTSTRSPGSHFVVPKDTAKSFLYATLVNNFAGYTCNGGDCGQSMPPTPNAPLNANDLQQVQLWIQEGAANN